MGAGTPLTNDEVASTRISMKQCATALIRAVAFAVAVASINLMCGGTP